MKKVQTYEHRIVWGPVAHVQYTDISPRPPLTSDQKGGCWRARLRDDKERTVWMNGDHLVCTCRIYSGAGACNHIRGVEKLLGREPQVWFRN